MDRWWTVVALISVTALSGCLGGTDGVDTVDDGPPGAVVPRWSAADPVRASPPGHRISEFNVASDPTTPGRYVVAAMDYDDGTGLSPGCATFETLDGGASWTTGPVVPDWHGPRLRFDPWVAFAPDGTQHVICIDEKRVPEAEPASNGVFHTRWDADAGAWSPEQRLPTLDPAQRVDKSVLESLQGGTLLSCFGESGQGIVVSRSTDGGASWQTTPVGQGGGLCGAVFETGDGRVHVAFEAGDDAVVSSSRDGGVTWGERVVVGPQGIYPLYNNAYRIVTPHPMSAQAMFAVHPDGVRVAAAVPAWDEAAEVWRLDVHASPDAARSFHPVATPAFPASTCAGCHATFPQVAYHDSGVLGLQVTFTPPGGLGRETWFTLSGDDGATWDEPVLLRRTGADESYLSPDTWLPEADDTVAAAQYLAENPGEAPAVVAWAALSHALVEPMQFRWGGEYWDMTATPEGFLALWLDFHDGGVPSLWSSRITLG